MNRLFKTFLCAVFCIVNTLPAFSKIQVETESDSGVTTYMAIDDETIFYSNETIDDSGLSASAGQSQIALILGTSIVNSNDTEIALISFSFTGPDALILALEREKLMRVKFYDLKTIDLYPSFTESEDGIHTAVFILGATSCELDVPGKLPMNEAMIKFATENIAEISCGGKTFHFYGHTADLVRSEFDALFKQKGVSKEPFSVYLNSVNGNKSSASTKPEPKAPKSSASSKSDKSSKSATSVAPKSQLPASKPSARVDDSSTGIAALIKNPAGFSSRSPFTSPGIYEDSFKSYASSNSLRYRTRTSGQNQVLVFDNGVVPCNLMGYECKFVANFKNQILNGYAYQTQVVGKEQAMKIAGELASEIEGLPNVAPASGSESTSGSMFSRQYLYGAGTKLTVDALHIDGRYFVSLTVTITHF